MQTLEAEFCKKRPAFDFQPIHRHNLAISFPLGKKNDDFVICLLISQTNCPAVSNSSSKLTSHSESSEAFLLVEKKKPSLTHLHRMGKFQNKMLKIFV